MSTVLLVSGIAAIVVIVAFLPIVIALLVIASASAGEYVGFKLDRLITRVLQDSEGSLAYHKRQSIEEFSNKVAIVSALVVFIGAFAVVLLGVVELVQIILEKEIQ